MPEIKGCVPLADGLQRLVAVVLWRAQLLEPWLAVLSRALPRGADHRRILRRVLEIAFGAAHLPGVKPGFSEHFDFLQSRDLLLQFSGGRPAAEVFLRIIGHCALLSKFSGG